jgi:hypothetical protein
MSFIANQIPQKKRSSLRNSPSSSFINQQSNFSYFKQTFI